MNEAIVVLLREYLLDKKNYFMSEVFKKGIGTEKELLQATMTILEFIEFICPYKKT